MYKLFKKNILIYGFFFYRTDQGVHAFKSSAHIDLELPYSSDPNKIVFQVNSFLSSCEVPIKYVQIILFLSTTYYFHRFYVSIFLLFV